MACGEWKMLECSRYFRNQISHGLHNKCTLALLETRVLTSFAEILLQRNPSEQPATYCLDAMQQIYRLYLIEIAGATQWSLCDVAIKQHEGKAHKK